MTISNEAVEAAARAIFGDPHGETWALQVPATQERCREDSRLALEAAAPFIRADAGAKALEDAADALDTLWDLRKVRMGECRDWADGVEESEALVRAHAAAVRGEG